MQRSHRFLGLLGGLILALPLVGCEPEDEAPYRNRLTGVVRFAAWSEPSAGLRCRLGSARTTHRRGSRPPVVMLQVENMGTSPIPARGLFGGNMLVKGCPSKATYTSTLFDWVFDEVRLEAPLQPWEFSSADHSARMNSEPLRLVSRLAKIPKMEAVIVKFVRKLDEQLRAMEDARRREDFDQLAELAHWLKGAGGTVGFDAFTDPARNLEVLAKLGTEAGIDDAIAELRYLANALVVEDTKEERAPISAAVN